MSAQEIRAYRTTSTRLVRIEERDKLLGNLVQAGIGLKEVEEFVEETKLRGTRMNYKLKREIVAKTMKVKIRDNRALGDRVRSTRNHLRQKIEGVLGPRSRQCRWVMKSVKENGIKLRNNIRKKNMKKLNFLKGKYEWKSNVLDELKKIDKMRYGEAKLFNEDCDMKKGERNKPVIVCRGDEEIQLSDEELDVLALGLKFCIFK